MRFGNIRPVEIWSDAITDISMIFDDESLVVVVVVVVVVVGGDAVEPFAVVHYNTTSRSSIEDPTLSLLLVGA